MIRKTLFFFLSVIVVIGYLCFPAFSEEERKPLTPKMIRELLGTRIITSNRITNLIKARGIDFGELEDLSEFLEEFARKFLGKLPEKDLINIINAIRREWERSGGILIVESNVSKAIIYINGKEKGYTPKKIRLPDGTYRLVLRKGVGYTTWEQDVSLEAGKPKKIFALLERILPIEDFNNNSNGWNIGGWDFGHIWIKDGRLSMVSKEEKGRGNYCWSKKMDLSNFTIEAKIRKVSGYDNSAWFGIVFRFNRPQNNKNGYCFLIKGDGYFGLWRSVNNTRVPLIIDLRKSPFINKGNTSNILKVKCYGSQISLYVNDNFLVAITDEYFNRGKVGFWVENLLHINVDYLQVSKLDTFDTFQEKKVLTNSGMGKPLTDAELTFYFGKHRLLFSDGEVQIVQRDLTLTPDDIFVFVGGKQIGGRFTWGTDKTHIGYSLKALLSDIGDYKKEVEVGRVIIIKDAKFFRQDEYYILVDGKVVFGPLQIIKMRRAG